MTIPDSVTSISEKAFYNCTNLKNIVSFPSVPPTLGTSAIPTTTTIYVQQSSKEAYKTETNWISFAEKIKSNNIYLSLIRFNKKNKEYIAEKLNEERKYIEESIDSAITGDPEWLSKVYPIGSIYVSAGSTSPASLFGGTWAKLEGKFLLGTDSSHTLGSTGGEATHTLTVDEMPSHTHAFSKTPTFGTKGDWDGGCQTMYDGESFYKGSIELSINATGGGSAHNNMPPYLAVNIWKRTA